MDFDKIIQDIDNRIFHPVYFLHGEEPYFIDLISDYIENKVLTEAEKAFNQSVFYGRDSNPMAVMESARRFPMMANQQVIIVKEAQDWKDWEPLKKYMASPSKTTILVINHKYKKIDGRSALAGLLKKNALVFESAKVKDYQLPVWINNYIKKTGYAITPQATSILADNIGNDLTRIVSELNKLFIVVPEKTQITPELIETYIGISKDYNIYSLSDALLKRDMLKALRITNYYKSNTGDNSMARVIPNLFDEFLKLFKYHFLSDKSERNVMKELRLHHPYFVKELVGHARLFTPTKLFEIFGILREYEMKSKGVGTTGSVSQESMYKEMIFRMLN